jgi:hypothetical protein
MNSPSDFAENGIDFQDHIMVDHEMWLYPNYIKYLQSKQETDMNGDELSVWTCYKEGSDDWMPHHFTEYLKVKFFFNFEEFFENEGSR